MKPISMAESVLSEGLLDCDLAGFTHEVFDMVDGFEGILGRTVSGFRDHVLESLREDRVLGDPFGNRPQGFRGPLFDLDLGANRGVIATIGFLGLCDVNMGVSFWVKLKQLPRSP